MRDRSGSNGAHWVHLCRGLLLASFVAGCGGGDSTAPDRVAGACGRIVDAICAKWVECKVLQSGVVMTAAACAQARNQMTTGCQRDEGSGITAATDAEVDACVQGFQQFQCSNLCNQVPQDPSACQAISPEPNTTVTSCAP